MRITWLVMVFLALTAPARAEMVRDWQNPMYYPVRVIAVEWDSGRLDARNSVRFGAWTISFGQPPKYAAHVWSDNFTIGLDHPTLYRRNGFICRNAALGTTSCDLKVERGECMLRIPHIIQGGREDLTRPKMIPIPCPTGLDLAQ